MTALAATLAPVIFGERIDVLRGAVLASVALSPPSTAVPVAELQRRLNFGRIGLVQATASVVGLVVAVVLAAYGIEGESRS